MNDLKPSLDTTLKNGHSAAMISETDILAVERCICHNIPFVIYALPGDEHVTFYASRAEREVSDTSIPHTVIQMAATEGDESASILNEFTAQDIVGARKLAFGEEPEANRLEASTSASNYLAEILNIREMLTNDNRKIVASRIIYGHTDSSIADILQRLFTSLPDTLRILFYSSATGLWIGATPELLLHAEKSDVSDFACKTIALAGTKAIEDNSDWDEKNSVEQQIVADHISRVLDSNQQLPYISTSYEKPHGEVKHLCTEYQFNAPANLLKSLVDSLHPTPAVIGYPVKQAIKAIESYETHDRLCYTGLINIFNPTETDKLESYVLLRCARLQPATHEGWDYNIFTGGGIMRKSEPADEWNEGRRKAIPIIKILNGDNAAQNIPEFYQQIAIEETLAKDLL